MNNTSDQTIGEPLVLEITAAGTTVISAQQAQQIYSASLSLAQKLARAVLLFYGPSPWTPSNQREWEELTGEVGSTTRALCDLARRVKAEAQKGTISPIPQDVYDRAAIR